MQTILSVLPNSEVQFFSSASPVYSARLFQWAGGLYRAIRPAHADLFQRLLREGILEDLTEQGLIVKSEEVPLSVEDYGLVLKHPRIPFVTYPFEWPAQALKDAALQHVRLNLELIKYGLICQDAHPWNLVFNGANPVYVDVGSIMPLAESNPDGTIHEFNSKFYYPLRLMNCGQRRVARRLLADLTSGITEREFTALSGWRSPFGVFRSLRRMGRRLRRSTYKRLGRTASAKDHIAVWRRAEDAISGVSIRSPKTFWKNYYGGKPVADEPDTPKERQVAEILGRLKPNQVFDIACNTGRYSRLAVGLGARVAACDVDESCVDRSYADAKLQQLPLTTLVMDIRVPPAGQGWSGRTFLPAMDRLRADCVLALALIHHLVFFQMADLELVADALSRFTTRNLIVEFVSREDPFVARWWKPGFDWYTLENFKRVLGARFERVVALPSHSAGRTILVCEEVR